MKLHQLQVLFHIKTGTNMIMIVTIDDELKTCIHLLTNNLDYNRYDFIVKILEIIIPLN